LKAPPSDSSLAGAEGLLGGLTIIFDGEMTSNPWKKPAAKPPSSIAGQLAQPPKPPKPTGEDADLAVAQAIITLHKAGGYISSTALEAELQRRVPEYPKWYVTSDTYNNAFVDDREFTSALQCALAAFELSSPPELLRVAQQTLQAHRKKAAADAQPLQLRLGALVQHPLLLASFTGITPDLRDDSPELMALSVPCRETLRALFSVLQRSERGKRMLWSDVDAEVVALRAAGLGGSEAEGASTIAIRGGVDAGGGDGVGVGGGGGSGGGGGGAPPKLIFRRARPSIGFCITLLAGPMKAANKLVPDDAKKEARAFVEAAVRRAHEEALQCAEEPPLTLAAAREWLMGAGGEKGATLLLDEPLALVLANAKEEGCGRDGGDRGGQLRTQAALAWVRNAGAKDVASALPFAEVGCQLLACMLRALTAAARRELGAVAAELEARVDPEAVRDVEAASGKAALEDLPQDWLERIHSELSSHSLLLPADHWTKLQRKRVISALRADGRFQVLGGGQVRLRRESAPPRRDGGHAAAGPLLAVQGGEKGAARSGSLQRLLTWLSAAGVDVPSNGGGGGGGCGAPPAPVPAPPPAHLSAALELLPQLVEAMLAASPRDLMRSALERRLELSGAAAASVDAVGVSALPEGALEALLCGGGESTEAVTRALARFPDGATLERLLQDIAAEGGEGCGGEGAERTPPAEVSRRRHGAPPPALGGAAALELAALLDAAAAEGRACEGAPPPSPAAVARAVALAFLLDEGADACAALARAPAGSAVAGGEKGGGGGAAAVGADARGVLAAARSGAARAAAAAVEAGAPPRPPPTLVAALAPLLALQENGCEAASSGAPPPARRAELPSPMTALAAVPLLEDAAAACAWADAYEPQCGPLLRFLGEPLVAAEASAKGLRWLEEPRGTLLRLPSAAEAQAVGGGGVAGLRRALERGEPRLAAALLAEELAFGAPRGGARAREAALREAGAAVKAVGALAGGGAGGKRAFAELLLLLLVALPHSLRRAVGAAVVLPALCDGDGLGWAPRHLEAVARAAGAPQGLIAALAAAAAATVAAARCSEEGQRPQPQNGAPWSAEDLLAALLPGGVIPAAKRGTGVEPCWGVVGVGALLRAAAPAPPPPPPPPQPALPVPLQPTAPTAAPLPQLAQSSDEDDILARLADLEPPPCARDARVFIDHLHRRWLAERNSLSGPAAVGATEQLSGKLYEHASHFLYELLQNSDDARYADGEQPRVALAVEPAGDGGTMLTLTANELGFRTRDIRAVSTVANSSKMAGGGSTGRKFMHAPRPPIAPEKTRHEHPNTQP
jgi:hypothetical protein